MWFCRRRSPMVDAGMDGGELDGRWGGGRGGRRTRVAGGGLAAAGAAGGGARARWLVLADVWAMGDGRGSVLWRPGGRICCEVAVVL